MILRFFALFEEWENYKKPMNEFLTKYLQQFQYDKKINIQDIFKKVIKIIYDNLGKNAFKLGKTGINKAFFDALMVGIGLCLNENKLNEKNFKKKYEFLKKDKEIKEWCSQSTTQENYVKNRIKKCFQIFQK